VVLNSSPPIRLKIIPNNDVRTIVAGALRLLPIINTSSVRAGCQISLV
jgi:hypothetical protein